MPIRRGPPCVVREPDVMRVVVGYVYPWTYRQNGPSASEDESVGSKRRRNASNHGQVPDSGRSVGSEGSASAQPKNKKRFVWPDDLHR